MLKSSVIRSRISSPRAFLAIALLLFLCISFTPVFGQAQVKKGSVVARGLVYGPEGFQIWAEYGLDGRPIRVINEASPANGLDEANVISGKDYLTYAKAYNDFIEQHREGIAKGAYFVSREDYVKLTFKTVATKQPPKSIEPPKLSPFTKSVLVRAPDQLIHEGINPVLLQSGINLKTIDPRVTENILSVLLDKQGNVREASPNIIAYRMAYFVKNEAGIYDTALDDMLYYPESMGAKPVAPLRGVFVGAAYSQSGGSITDQEGKYHFFYVIPACPGFFYSVDTLVWAELHYLNFNPKSPKINTYYATVQSVDMCSGDGSMIFGFFIPSSSLFTFKHIIPVDMIMFRGEGNLFNKWMGPTQTTQEIGPRIKVEDQTIYDEGEDEEINQDWPKADEPEKRLIKSTLWDLDQDGLSDLAVADKEKGIVKFWKRGKDPLHHSPSLSREMRIKKLENALDPKELAPADFKGTDLFVYKGNKLVAKHVGLDEKLYDKDRNIYLIYPEVEAEVKEGDELDAVLTCRDPEAGYLGRTSGKMTKLGIEVELKDVSLNAPAYEIESTKEQTHRGLLKSIKPEDLQDTDVYLFSENTGKLLSERLGLQYVAEEGENDKMLTFWIKTLGPRQEIVNPGSYISKTQAQIELFKKEVAHLRVGSRVKAIVINRKTGYIGTVTTEVKKTIGEGLGSSSIDFPLGKIELYPPNLKIWAERTYKVKQGLTKDQERENVISFGGSGLTSDTLVVVKTAWLDHDGSLLPEELPGYTGRLVKVVGTNQVGLVGSGDAALFTIKPGYHTHLIELLKDSQYNEHFYVQVCALPKEGRGGRNPSFASGNASGKLEFRPEYYVPVLVPFFNADLTLLNAQAQAGKLAQEWKDERGNEPLQEGEQGPVLKDIEKVYDWFYRPELQFSLFELDLDKLKVDITTEIGSGTTAIVDYFLKSPKFDPLAPFGPQRQLLLSLGYSEILALLNEEQKGQFPGVDDLFAMQPAARLAMLQELLGRLEPEDFLGLQLYQADDEGNGLFEFYGLPLAVSDSRYFELKNIYNSSQFDLDVPATIGGSEIPAFKALELYLMQPATAEALILDKDNTPRGTLIEKMELPPGRYNFFVDFKTIEKAINYDPEDPKELSEFRILVLLKDQDGIVSQKILYPGRLSIAPEGEMMGQILVHDVLIQDGSLNLSRQDLVLKGRGPALGFSRNYSNLTPVNNDSVLGTGWSHNYDQKLCARCSEQDAGEECIPAWVQEKFGTFFRPSQIPDTDADKWTMVVVNGTTFKKANNTWKPERGKHGRLEETENAQTNTFVYTAKDGTQYEYDYPKREKPDERFAYIQIGDSIITRIGLNPQLLELMKPEGEEPPSPADPPKPAPIKSIRDRNGNRMAFIYQEIKDQDPEQGKEPRKQKQLVQVMDSMGRSLSFEYKFMTAGWQGRQARLMKVIGPDNIVLNLEYDQKGYLTRAQRGARTEQYEYQKEPSPDKDAYNLTKTSDTNGNSHQYEYYLPKDIENDPDVFVKYLRSQDVIKSVTYPDGLQAGFSYSMSTYNQRTVQDLRGNNTTYILNKYGNPTEIQEPENRTTHMTWSIDENGKRDNVMTSRRDGRGNLTTYQYDDQGNIRVETDPYGHTITTNWDPKFSQPLNRRDRNGVYETWDYDPENGDLQTYTNGDYKTYSYTYYATGERQTLTNPKQGTIHYTYDAYGNPDTMTGPENSLLDQDYDLRGRLVRQTDPNGNTTTYTYDDLDYPRTVLHPDLLAYALPAGSSRFETFLYDAEGNLQQETNRLGLTFTYTYTSRNQIERIARSSGGEKRFRYDPNGNLQFETDWNGNQTLYEHDGLNRRVLIAKSNTMHLTYDLNDNVTEVKDYNEKVTVYYYDELNRVYMIAEPSIPGQPLRIIGREYNNEADPKKNLKKETDQDGHSTSFKYNGRYQVVERTNALGDVYKWDYDANGNLAQETDEEGKVTSYEYDGQNRLRYVHKPLNNKIEFRYDANGNRTHVIDPIGYATETKYDEWNRPYKTIDAEGNATTTYRDALANPMQITDANGNSSYFSRNANGLVIQTIDAESNSTTYNYDFNGNLTYSANPIGRTVNITYDEEGRPKTIMESGFGVSGGSRTKEVLERDPMGNPLRVKDFNGNVIRAEYNAANLIDRIYDPEPFEKQVTEIKYTAGGRAKEIRNARGYKTEYEYDELDRPRVVTDAKNNTVVVTYDKTGHVKTVKDKRGIMTENEYDDLYRVIETKKDNLRIVTNEYDGVGNLKAVIDAEDNRTEHTYYKNNLPHITTLPTVDMQTHKITRSYDKVGNIEEMIDPEGKIISYTYDRNNRPVTIEFAGETIRKTYDGAGNLTRVAKPAGNIQEMHYDSFNRLIRAIDDVYGRSLATTFEYDANGNLTHQYDPKGQHVEYTYDALNRKKAHIQHTRFGEVVTSYDQYDAEDNLKEMTDPNGNRFTYEYDELNRRVAVNYPDLYQAFNPLKVTTEYDENSNITRVTETKRVQGISVTDVTVNRYDRFDRLIESTQRGLSVAYTYDKNGNRRSLSTPAASTQYAYDARNRLKTVTAGYAETAYEYYADGKPKSIRYPNSTGIDYEYNDQNRVKTVTNRSTGFGTIISQYSYEYDRNGNRLRQVAEQNNRTETTTYNYDSADRLAWFRITDNVDTDITEYTYQGYDRKTERITRNGTLVKSRGYNYDELNRLTEIYDDTDITKIKTIAYTYDNNGNTLTKKESALPDQDMLFKYNALDQLTEVKRGPPGSEEVMGRYDYNAEGQRVRHFNGERGDVDSYYDGDKLIEERKNGTNNLLAHYRHAGLLHSMETDTDVEQYHYDGLGSTVNLTNHLGTQKAGYQLDPWGRIRKQTGESLNRQIFTGQEHDFQTGLIYFGARYYDPDTGRFITQDSYLGDPNEPASLHRYLYAYGNPCYYTDENGNFAFIPVLAYFALAAIIGTESHVIYQEIAYGRDLSTVDYRAAFTFGAKIGIGTAGIALSGGTSLGVMGTAGLFSSIAGFNIFTRLAHDKQSLMEMDWAGVYAQSGAMTGIGAIVGPFIGKALSSQNLLLNYGTRTALGSLGGYGGYEGGKHAYEGYANNDWALAAYGATELVGSVYGTLQLFKSGVYPRLKQSVQLTEENIAGGASVKMPASNTSGSLVADEGAEAAAISLKSTVPSYETPHKPLSKAQYEGLLVKRANRTLTRDEYNHLRWDQRFANRRATGVRKFWAQERTQLRAGQSGTRNWTEKQKAAILRADTPYQNGKSVVGHHKYNALDHPQIANDPTNIYPATYDEHLYRWHGGSWRNDTFGEPLKFEFLEEF